MAETVQDEVEVPGATVNADGSVSIDTTVVPEDKPEETPEEKPEGETPEEKPAEEKPPVVPDLKSLDMAALSKEFIENGGLKPETLADLEAKGFTKAMVDAHIENAKAEAQKLSREMASVVGGEEQLNSILKWAEKGLTAEEIASFNATIDSGNLAATRLALKGLAAVHAEAVGTEFTSAVRENTPGVRGVEPFASQDDVVEAMMDKRYKTSESYRAKVAARLAVTEMSGVAVGRM